MTKLENESCPKCGSKMESGYIYSTRDIRWTDNDKRKFTALGDEAFVESFFTMKKLVSCRCKDCKIVMFEYDSSK